MEENPYNYRNELIRLLLEYFIPRFLDTTKDKIRQTLLLTLFIDIRKYADEFLAHQQEQNRIMMVANTPLVKVFVFGLDNAGKSSLMRFLATNKYDPNYFPPTKKFRITNIKLTSGVKLVCWDMPGQKIFRQDWLRGAQASNILLYVLDLADTNRYQEAKDELYNMLDLYELQGIPLVFLANKVDLAEAKAHINDFEPGLALAGVTQREVKIIVGSIAENQGISEIVQWIESRVSNLLIDQGIVQNKEVIS
jgi:small GTP-binding protein